MASCCMLYFYLSLFLPIIIFLFTFLSLLRPVARKMPVGEVLCPRHGCIEPSAPPTLGARGYYPREKNWNYVRNMMQFCAYLQCTAREKWVPRVVHYRPTRAFHLIAHEVKYLVLCKRQTHNVAIKIYVTRYHMAMPILTILPGGTV